MDSLKNDTNPRKRVLIIDDNREMASLYCQILSEAGYETIWKGNSKKALEEWPNEVFADLILVDYSLPELNGEEFAKEFKKRYPENYSKIPLVVFSSHSTRSPVAQGVREAGALFLEKPYDIDQFVESIGELIKSF